MAAKPVTFRVLASVDLDSAADYYIANAVTDVGVRFVDAVEGAARRVGRNPGLGNLRFSYELSIPDLRAVTIRRFPYVMFYVERSDAVEVWRLLHTSRDIPPTLRDNPTG